MALKENYKDDILDVSVNTKRKYRMTENQDGTVSFDDETVYTQEGDSFGASDMNATNGKVNTLETNIGEINDNLSQLASKALVYNEEDDTYGVIIDEQYYIIGKAGLKEVDMLKQEANYWSGVIGVFTSSGLGNTWHQSSQSGTFTPNTSITLSAKENSSGGSGVAYYCGYEIVTTKKMNLSNFNKLKITFSSRNFTDQYTRFQVALYDTDGVAHVLYNEKPDSNNLEFDISSYGLDCKIGVCVGAMEGGNRTASCTISAIKVVKETS